MAYECCGLLGFEMASLIGQSGNIVIYHFLLQKARHTANCTFWTTKQWKISTWKKMHFNHKPKSRLKRKRHRNYTHALKNLWGSSFAEHRKSHSSSNSVHVRHTNTANLNLLSKESRFLQNIKRISQHFILLKHILQVWHPFFFYITAEVSLSLEWTEESKRRSLHGQSESLWQRSVELMF